MSDEIDLDDEDDAVLAVIWDRRGRNESTRADAEWNPETGRALLVSALGQDRADSIECPPETRGEFDAMMARLGVAMDFATLAALRGLIGGPA